MRKLLTKLLTTTFCLLMVCAVQAQTYDECGYPGPSNPAVEPVAPINPAYPQTTPVICADGAFPECSTPTTANGDTEFAAACGSPNYDFIITNPQNTTTGDGGAAIVEVSADGSFNPTGAAPPDFAVGDQACVTGFCYDLQQIIDLVNEINDNPTACSAAESTAGVPVCPIPVPTSLSDLFTLASTIGGGGSVSVGDVVTILPDLDALGNLGINNVPVCGLLSGGDTAAGANQADYCMEVVDCSENGSPCEVEAPCAAIDLTAPPAAPVVSSESTCGADGMTLEGGMIDYSGSTCPEGSTLEYATDGMTFTTTAPMYDQDNAITVTVRCTCDADMTMTSPTAEVTTVPGACDAAPCEGIDLTAAPAAPVVSSESTCGADGMTLEGGVIDYAGSTCPAGSTLEYATDGMTFTTTAPMYDQNNAITVTVRCTCDADMMMTSPTAEVTTMPGSCDPPGECTVVAAEPPVPQTDVCVAGQGPGPNGEMEITPTIDNLMTLGQFGMPTGTNGSGTAPTTNYVITDGAGVVLDVVGNAESMAYDFSAFYGGIGSSFCVYQAAYTQETIDDIAMALNDVLCTTLCAAGAGCVGDLIGAGCPVLTAPTELAGVLDVLVTVFDLAGQPLTAADIDNFLANQVITIPTGSIPVIGPLVGDFDFNLADFGLNICGDLSNMGACFNVVNCNEPCDPAVCNNVTFTIASFDWTGLDDQFTLGLEGADGDLELAYTIDGVPYLVDGAAAGTDPQPAGQTITGSTSAGSSTIMYEVCFWENDCGVDTDYDNDTSLLGPCLGNADDPFGDSALEGAATACEMIAFDITTGMVVGTNYSVIYTVMCNPITIANVMPMPDAICNGDDAEYTICFDAANGSGNYDLYESDGAGGITGAVLGTVAGADGNLCIGPVTIAGPTTAGTLDVTVVDQSNTECLGNVATVNIPACPVAACSGIDSAILPVIPTEVCSGATADICLTLLDATQGLVITGSIDGAPIVLTGMPGAGPNELCVTITAPVNMTCDLVPVTIQIDMIQCTDGTDFPGILGGATLVDDLTAAGFNPIEIPVYPTLVVNTMGDGMCGTLTATLEAADGTVCATAMGSPFTCTADGEVLDFDFTDDASLSDFIAVPTDCPLPALSGTLTCTDCNDPVVMGCTDPCADNFDPAATMDDGSCNPVDTTCNTDCTMGPFGGSFDPVACACTNQTEPVLGCTDPNADNFNVAANCDDGTCIIVTPCNFSVGVSAFTCNDGGTMDDPSNDTADVTFIVLSNGADFTTDVAIGGLAAGTVGMDGMLLTEIGVAAGTNIVVTFTSVDDPNCTFVLDYTVPDCTVQVPTLSQWGLISLALLLMIMGSLKLGFSTTTFITTRK